MTSIWGGNEPSVVNVRDVNPRAEEVVLCHRPHPWGNPFPVGGVMSFQNVCSWLSKVPFLDVVVTEDWLDENLPVSFHYIKRRETIKRGKAIQLFIEYWNYVRTNQLVTDEEILALAGKKLACFCHPKDCHVEVIAADYNETYRKHTDGK